MTVPLPSTVRLDHEDPRLADFTARVLAHTTHRGRPAVVLDQSVFYPESGGQHADRGTLAEAAVVDVQVDEQGVVYHVVQGESPAVGTEVTGRLDRARRRRHMALHTGQHMLSQALLDVAGAATVSSHLSQAGCTLDVDVPALCPEQLRAAENAVNAVVDRDVAVRTWFPSDVELATLALRRPPKVDTHVRVVAVGDYDRVACGGTHCTHTSQVGWVLCLSAERYKGMTRVHFLAGPAARDLARTRLDALERLGAEFTCRPDLVPRAVHKLQREHDALGTALHALREQVAAGIAERLLAEVDPADGLVVAMLPDASTGPDLLRSVGRLVVAAPGRAAALAAPVPDGLAIFVARGEGHPLHCGDLVRRICTAAGGRGGGRADHAEGRLPATVDWAALVRTHVRP